MLRSDDSFDQATLQRLDELLSKAPPDRIDETQDMVILIHELKIRRQDLVEAIFQRDKLGPELTEDLDLNDLDAPEYLRERVARVKRLSATLPPEDRAFFEASLERLKKEFQSHYRYKEPRAREHLANLVNQLKKEIAEREAQLLSRLIECRSWFTP